MIYISKSVDDKLDEYVEFLMRTCHNNIDEAAQMGFYLIDKLGNNEYLIPYTSRMRDANNDDDKYFFEKFGTGW